MANRQKRLEDLKGKRFNANQAKESTQRNILRLTNSIRNQELSGNPDKELIQSLNEQLTKANGDLLSINARITDLDGRILTLETQIANG